MRVFRKLVVAILASICVVSASAEDRPAAACGKCVACQNVQWRREDRWNVLETNNFSIWSRLSQAQTMQLACTAERLRASIRNLWQSTAEDAQWPEKCILVLHANVREYQNAVKCGNNPSAGCTTITVNHGQVVFRRIDLRADAADWQVNALPHELTHVVLADRFPEQNLPAWINEGLAMTAESSDLQRRRLQVLEVAHQQGRRPALERILNAESLAGFDTDVFYAVSYSVTEFLLNEEGGADALLEFVEHSRTGHAAESLKKTYSIEAGISELERKWLLAAIRNRQPGDLASR